MRLIPAIDILDSKVVRLHQGDYADSIEYASSPLEQLKIYELAGAKLVHIVDLDAAKKGEFVNDGVIRNLLTNSNTHLQVAGGIRSEEDLKNRIDVGVHRIVIGSYLISHTAEFCNWLDKYGADKLVAAIDVRQNDEGNFIPQVKGWTEAADVTLFDLLDNLSKHGLKHLLCTDISRDGMLSGPNYDLYHTIQNRYPEIIVQASGGVATIEDLGLLESLGIKEVISGKALLDGRIDLIEAVGKYAA